MKPANTHSWSSQIIQTNPSPLDIQATILKYEKMHSLHLLPGFAANSNIYTTQYDFMLLVLLTFCMQGSPNLDTKENTEDQGKVL